MIKFICSKCGKELEVDDDYLDNGDKYSQIWDAEEFHRFSLPYVGYGSSFDGCNGEFTLCDDCLYELVNSFTTEGKEKVWNTGANNDCDTETWIKHEKGELTDEEVENETPYLSKRQINAYKNQYPLCDKVKNYIYADGSSGSHCHSHAFGELNGELDDCGNISSNCFNCPDFKKRDEGDSYETIYVKD